MCMLCDQALQVNRRVDGRALYGLSIAPVELIDDDNVATTRHLTATTVFSITTSTRKVVQ